MLKLEGRPVARAITDVAREELAEIVKQRPEGTELAAVLVGADPGSRAYFRAIKRTCDRVGLDVRMVELPGDIDAERLRAAFAELNQAVSVVGIIALQPFPDHLPRSIASGLIDPCKDVDGITPDNIGRLAAGMACLVPSTPGGGMEILRHYNIPIEGQHAVVLGRSLVVGRPMAQMLLAADATVTICHSRTPNLAEFTRQADIVATATGRAGLLTADMVKPGATVIDFGVNVVNGTIVGDVDPSVGQVAGALTPVPGGTGVVTNAVLVRNTLMAARQQARGASALPPLAMVTHRGLMETREE